MHIDEYHFGKIVIDGQPYAFDLMICGEEIYQKWWRKEGHHLCLEDLEWILDRRPDVLVIGQGNAGCMKVTGDVVDQLTQLGIEVRTASTGEAVEIYNRIEGKEGRRVGATFHLTC